MTEPAPSVRRRVPVVATLVVALAVLAMLGLGIWQYQRANEKERLIALYRANAGAAGDVAFPATGPVPDTALFRRSGVACLAVSGWRAEGGRAPGGGAAYRYIADCRTGAEGPGAVIQAGMSAEPNLRPRWAGGSATGWIAAEPDHRTLLDRILRRGAPPRPMLVLDRPVAGLSANARPDPADVPNNHRAYMWQWFLFAGIAAVIYALALRQRGAGDHDARGRTAASR